MGILDDILNPGVTMLGPQGVKGTAALADQPQPKKKVQSAPPTPAVAKAAPVDVSDNPFAAPGGPDVSGNPFASGGDSGPDALVQQLHADYAAGHLATAEHAKSAVDPERRSADRTGSPLDAALGSVVQGGETAASGIPGAAMALASLRSLTTGESYHDAQAEQAKEITAYTRAHPVASMALKTLAAAPLASVVPGGAVTGGAAYGALDNALDPNLEESGGTRLWNTVTGGAEGAAAGKLLENGGALAAKIGAKTGITDALSTALDRAGQSRVGQIVQELRGAPDDNVLSDVGAALGTRGAVNAAAADRRAITDAVGGNESPADLLTRRVQEGQAAAKPLYDAATAQANAFEAAPAAAKSRLDEILARADQKALPAPGQSEIERRAAQDGLAAHDYTAGAAPTLEDAAAHDYTATTPAGVPFAGNDLAQRDFTVERPVQLRAANDVMVRQPAGAPVSPQAPGAPDRFAAAENATQTALANPHVQMQLKSLLGDAPSLQGDDLGSYEVLRKVQANMNAEYGKLKATGQDSGPYWHELNGARADVNAALLAKAPALAEANATFAREVGIPREGITKGQTMGLNPTGKAAFKRSPDAITQWIESATTPADQAARANAVSAGVSAQLGQKVSGVPLGTGTRGVLDLPILNASEAGADARGLLDPTKRAALHATLRDLDTKAATEGANQLPRGVVASLWHGPAQYPYLTSPAARGPLRDVSDAMAQGTFDPSGFQRGQGTLDKLQDVIRALTVARAGQIAAP